MIKSIIFIMSLLLLVTFVHADFCGDSPDISTQCQMVTPTGLVCNNLTYSIYNATSTLIATGKLTPLNSSAYYFNFTQEEGRYLIVLCDGGTREVFVTANPNNLYYLYIIALVVFIFLIGFGFYLKDVWPIVISGFLAGIIGIGLYVYGFPGLTNSFLKDTMVIVLIGIGMYLMVAPMIEEIEKLF